MPAQPEDTPGHEPDGSDPGSFQERVNAARDEIESQVAQARERFDQTNERIKERTGRDLISAIVVGLLIGGIVLVALIVVPWLLGLIALVIALFGIHELVRAFQDSGRHVDYAPQMVVGAAVLAVGYFGGAGPTWIAVLLGIVAISAWRLLAQMASGTRRVPREVVRDLLVGAFIPVYVPFLLALALVLLQADDGQWWVLAFLATVVVADTAAYASGLAFGRHPMAPRISPKKTWEGFAGAAAGALLAGALLGVLLLQISLWAGLVFGAVVVITATIGDLGESMIKRDLGIKDMSSAVPGHGGVLDRLDSVLPSAAAALLLHTIFIPLGAS